MADRDACTCATMRGGGTNHAGCPAHDPMIIDCASCNGSGDYYTDDGADHVCGTCNGSGTSVPFVPRSARPTTPTPEPVARDPLLRLCKPDVAKIAVRHAIDHTGNSYGRPDEYVYCDVCDLVAEIADLRGKLERAERERNDAIIERNCAQTMAELDRAERDAATSRATEAERLLFLAREALFTFAQPETIEALKKLVGEQVRGSSYINYAATALTRLREVLSTLPGSKETPDAQG